jgi:hypothetical protein
MADLAELYVAAQGQRFKQRLLFPPSIAIAGTLLGKPYLDRIRMPGVFPNGEGLRCIGLKI